MEQTHARLKERLDLHEQTFIARARLESMNEEYDERFGLLARQIKELRVSLAAARAFIVTGNLPASEKPQASSAQSEDLSLIKTEIEDLRTSIAAANATTEGVRGILVEMCQKCTGSGRHLAD